MEKFTIAIVGLGLIGGSLGFDLSRWSKKAVIRGYDVKEEALSVARKRGAIDLALPLEEAVRGADLVFIATPVRAIPQVFSRLRPFLSGDSVVFDLGSVKEWVFRAVSRDTLPWEYVGFHPMGGKEKGGIERAQRGLFTGVPILVSPPHLSERARSLVGEIAEVLGGQVFF